MPESKITGNGHHKWTIDLDRWPHWMQLLWLVFTRFGFYCGIAAFGVGLAAIWMVRVSIPKAQNEAAAIKETISNQQRTDENMKLLASNQQQNLKLVQDVIAMQSQLIETQKQQLDTERGQTVWMAEWKEYISGQHEARKAESEEARKRAELEAEKRLEWEGHVEEFFTRTDKYHTQQDEAHAKQMLVNEAMLEELRAMRDARKPTTSPTKPAPMSDGKTGGVTNGKKEDLYDWARRYQEERPDRIRGGLPEVPVPAAKTLQPTPNG